MNLADARKLRRRVAGDFPALLAILGERALDPIVRLETPDGNFVFRSAREYERFVEESWTEE